MWVLLESSSFFYLLNPHWFLQPEVMGTYLPGIGSLGWGPGMELGPLAPKISLPNFYLSRVGVGQPILHLCPSYRSVWMWFL